MTTVAVHAGIRETRRIKGVHLSLIHICNFNSEATYRPVDSTEQRSILQTCGRGYFVVAVLGVGPVSYTHLDVYKRQLLCS